jgi:hypothetical protein
MSTSINYPQRQIFIVLRNFGGVFDGLTPLTPKTIFRKVELFGGLIVVRLNTTTI